MKIRVRFHPHILLELNHYDLDKSWTLESRLTEPSQDIWISSNGPGDLNKGPSVLSIWNSHQEEKTRKKMQQRFQNSTFNSFFQYLTTYCARNWLSANIFIVIFKLRIYMAKGGRESELRPAVVDPRFKTLRHFSSHHSARNRTHVQVGWVHFLFFQSDRTKIGWVSFLWHLFLLHDPFWGYDITGLQDPTSDDR